MEPTTGNITIVILAVTLIVTLIASQVARSRRDTIILRHLPAYARLPLFISEALETNRRVHFAFGSALPGSVTTPLVLANAETFALLASRSVIGNKGPLLTMSEPGTLPVAYDVLRHAYNMRNRRGAFDIGAVQWYPEGARSLAYAGVLTSLSDEQHIGTHVMLGSFGPEIALVLDTAARRGQHAIVASDQLDGQAIAFALSDEALIGEEMYAAPAYLGSSTPQLGAVVALDTLRVGLIALLALFAFDRLSGGVVTEFASQLLTASGGR